jgi:hypothetical protein
MKKTSGSRRFSQLMSWKNRDGGLTARFWVGRVVDDLFAVDVDIDQPSGCRSKLILCRIDE